MLRLTSEAEQDVAESAAWYDGEHDSLGDAFLADVRTLLARIETAPHRYPKVRDRVRRALMSRFPYSVYFEPEDSANWVVLAVLHQRRDPSTWTRRITKL